MNTFPRRSILAPRFEKILHVVRNPFHQISSFATHTNQSYEFVAACIKTWNAIKREGSHDQEWVLEQDDPCERGARCNLPRSVQSWIFWNSFIDMTADGTYRLEDERERLMSDIVAYINGRRSHENYFRKLVRFASPLRRVLEPSKYHKEHARYGHEDIVKDTGVQRGVESGMCQVSNR